MRLVRVGLLFAGGVLLFVHPGTELEECSHHEMATQYDDPALSLRRHILKTSSLTDPDTGEWCSIEIQFTNG